MLVAVTCAALWLALQVRADDVVLLRTRHGTDTHAHRDAIRCAKSAGDDSGALRTEDLVEQLMLPSALWCETDGGGGALCHDRTAHRALRAVTLSCDRTSDVRCVAHFECADLAREFWIAAGATVLCCAALVATRAHCANGERRRQTKALGKML